MSVGVNIVPDTISWLNEKLVGYAEKYDRYMMWNIYW